jgi:hypothetical protein
VVEQQEAACQLQHAADFVWSLAALQRQLPPALLQTLFAAPAHQMEQLRPSQTCRLLSLLCKLPVALPAPWLLCSLQSLHTRLGACTGDDLCAVMTALACRRQRLRPPISWMRDVLQHLEPQLPGMGFDSLGRLGWALARLGITPPPPWRRRYEAASLGRCEGGAPLPFAMVTWAVARWGYPGPPLRWKQGFLRASQRVLHQLSPRELAMLASAVARLGGGASVDGPSALPIKWQRGLVRASQLAAGQASPRELTLLVWSVAKMRLQPRRSWQEAVLAASAASMGEMTAYQLAVTAEGLLGAGVCPPDDWVARWHLCVELKNAHMVPAELRAAQRAAAAFSKQRQVLHAV